MNDMPERQLEAPVGEITDDYIEATEKAAIPCPFFHSKDFGSPFLEEGDLGWFLTCECGTSIGPKDNPSEALRHWNGRRVIAPQISGVREGPRSAWRGW